MRCNSSSRRFVPSFTSLENRDVPTTFQPISSGGVITTPPPVAGSGPLPVPPVPVNLQKILNPYQPAPLPAPVYIAV